MTNVINTIQNVTIQSQCTSVPSCQVSPSQSHGSSCGSQHGSSTITS